MQRCLGRVAPHGNAQTSASQQGGRDVSPWDGPLGPAVRSARLSTCRTRKDAAAKHRSRASLSLNVTTI